jgi:ATP-binding cassette, subfamily B, bacterial CvaB/MchF/RaxB
MVLIDDVPLQAIGLEAYRAQIGCVLQDDRLFADSIAENIAGFSLRPTRNNPTGGKVCCHPRRDQGLLPSTKRSRFAAVHEEIVRMPMG